MKTKEINSTWSREVGDWDKTSNKYINKRIIEMPDKILTMEIIEKPSGDTIKFHGDPTGFASYYISTLLEDDFPERTHLCICAGTITGYPICL